jgi:hypothetical protein
VPPLGVVPKLFFLDKNDKDIEKDFINLEDRFKLLKKYLVKKEIQRNIFP